MEPKMVCVPVVTDSHLRNEDPDPDQDEKMDPDPDMRIHNPGQKNDLLEPGRWNLKVPREKEKVVPFFGIILKYSIFCVMCIHYYNNQDN